MSIRRLAIFALCAAAAYVGRCSHAPDIVSTGGSEVVGRMVKKDGTPVNGAYVYLDTAAYSSDTTFVVVTVTTTDSKGNFAFNRAHGGGTYSIYGDYHDRELVVLVRDIRDAVTSDVAHVINVGTDTMLPPGFIRGRALIDEPTMTGTVCYIPGTSLMAVTDDSGNFVMSGVPAGSFPVYCSHPDYLVGKALQVSVRSGDTTDMGSVVLLYDPNKPVPSPRSVILTYDTLQGVVNLSWHLVHVPDLKGYVVYRGINGSAIDGLDTVSRSDTVIHDTLYRSLTDSTRYTCQYEVAAFDSAPNYSGRSNPITFETVPPSFVRTVFVFRVSGFASDTIEAGDTVSILGTFSNVTGSTRLFTWYSKYPDSVLRQDSLNAKKGNDTLRHSFLRSGHVTLFVDAIDDRGASWLDSLFLFVRPRHVDAVSVDSTSASVVIKWTMSHVPAFGSYRLFRKRPIGDTLLYTTTVRTDTSHVVMFNRNGVFQYVVLVEDSLGIVSVPGGAINARIKNTPPQFTSDTSAIPPTASVGKRYSVELTTADVNGDSLSLKQISAFGLTFSKDTLIWVPVIADTGIRHVSVQVGDGFGGYDTLSWNVLVSPVGVCVAGDSMPTARFSLSAAIVNGELYAAGGARFFNSGGRLVPIPLSTVEAYPLSGGGSWTKFAPLVAPRYALGCASAGASLFAFGGTKDGVNHFAFVDSISGSGSVWDTAGMFPAPFAGSAVSAIGNKVYCTGGLTKVSGEDVVSDKIYEFDVTTGQCVFKNYMRTSRAFHQVAVLNGKLFIIGGLGGSTSQYDCVPQTSVEVYDPATNLIGPDTVGSLLTPRYYFGAAEANGKLYVIGGCPSANSDTSVSSIEEFDPATNVWTYKTDLPGPRSNFAAVAWQGRIYVLGGIIAGKATSSVVIYYP